MSKKEKKAIIEWCINCRFEKTEDGKYYRARKEASPLHIGDCLNCLYEAVKDIKVTKPKLWRKDTEEDGNE